MAGGVAPGSPVSSSNTNSAFIEKNADDATVGKLGLNNGDVTNSGAPVVNTQGEINGLNKFNGRTGGSGPISLPSWVNNDVGTNTDDVKTRADSITRKFNPTAGTGHQHTGTAGDAPQIAFSSLTGTGGIPAWIKYTVTYAQLAAAALTNDIELFQLAAKGTIHAVVVKHSANFTGGAIASYKISVGITGTLDRYASQLDVFSAPSNTNFQHEVAPGIEDFGAATSIRVAAVSTGANLNQATQGSVDIWVFGSMLP